jgi:hypothetical protein
MWRSALPAVVLAGLLAGCSLGGGSGGAASQATARRVHNQLDLVGSNSWATLWVKRLHPTGGARFAEIRCDVRKQGVVACAGYLSYADAPGDALRVQQYFRIRAPHKGSARLVPYCSPTSGMSPGTMPRIFCAQ